MVTNERGGKASLLFWLRLYGSDNDSYHAYPGRRYGTQSLCGQGPVITDMGRMDSGGSRSKCCSECFFELYDLSRIKARLEELGHESREDDGGA